MDVQESGPKCSGKEKFEDFKNLSAKLKGNSIGKELMEEGCPIPNCQERAWTVYFTEKFDNSENKSSSTLDLNFPHYTYWSETRSNCTLFQALLLILVDSLDYS